MADSAGVPGLAMPFSRKVDKQFKSKREVRQRRGASGRQGQGQGEGDRESKSEDRKRGSSL